jgi:hypothetical protein
MTPTSLRPMDYLTSQKRKRNLLVMSLLAVFLALICGGLTLWWTLRVREEHQAAAVHAYNDQATATTTVSTASLDDDNVRPSIAARSVAQNVASSALDALNRLGSSTTRLDGPKDGCECTLLVLRHCEKLASDDDDEDGFGKTKKDKHCSYLGYERAAFIPTLFETHDNRTTGTSETEHHVGAAAPLRRRRWPAPSRLYALTTQRHNGRSNYREWETIAPLSKSVGVDIELLDGNGERFAKDHLFPLLASHQLCGKLVVVSWKHSLIPSLVNAVGCGPDNGCPVSFPEDSFDQVWQVKFVFRPPTISLDPERHHGRRRMKHHHYHGAKSSHHHHVQLVDDNVSDAATAATDKDAWQVYASVTQQFFDPLAFSHSAGDYPSGGSAAGGRWRGEL